MIRDYGDVTLSPLKWGQIHDVFLQATFASGVATVDRVNSFPGNATGQDPLNLVKDTTGDYDVTFPKGVWVHVAGCALAPEDDTPGATYTEVVPFGFVAASGTGKVLFMNDDNTSGIGTQADPPDGSRLYLYLKVGRRV